MQALPDAWNHEEVNRILAQARDLIGFQSFSVDGSKGEIRIELSKLWRVTIRVLWDTGLRLGDAYRLNISDVSKDGVIMVSQRKTQQSHIVKLHPLTMELAKEIRRHTSGLLISWSKTQEWRRIYFRRDIVEPLGFQGPPKKLRKSLASDVELHHSGLGAFHLGHRAGKDITRLHYLDPRIIAKNRPMPSELTADL